MLRRAAAALARRHEALQEGLQGAAAWRTLQQSRAVHPAAVACHVEEPAGGADKLAAAPGATESVVFGSIARAAADANKKAAGGVPAVTKLLGFSGALPFWVFSPAVAPLLPLDILDPTLLTNAGMLQVGYGATILSFLGGVHWGLAMTNVGGELAFKMAEQRYLWSVLPCLMAWPTVAMPVGQAAGIQAALLGVVYLVDRSWAGKGLLPPWYMKMRLPLTLLAASGLLLTATTT